MLGLCGTLLGPRRLIFDQNWGSVGPYWGYVRARTRWAGLCWPILGLCWGYVGPSGVYIGARFAHLGAMLGLCWPIWSLCWGQIRPAWGYVRGYIGPSGVYIGARFAHLGAILGLCWPPGGDFGAMLFLWVHLHSQILLEKVLPRGLRSIQSHFCNIISLKKLNPAGDGHSPDERLKAPTHGLRGSRKRCPRGRNRVGGSGSSPINKAKICFSDGAAEFNGLWPIPPIPLFPS